MFLYLNHNTAKPGLICHAGPAVDEAILRRINLVGVWVKALAATGKTEVAEVNTAAGDIAGFFRAGGTYIAGIAFEKCQRLPAYRAVVFAAG